MNAHTVTPVTGIARLRHFVGALADVIEAATNEAAILSRGRTLLHDLIRVDDWLPEAFAQPSAERYQQYLLHADSQERFSVVSFVWGAGQSTPIHDHRVWGLVGILRGQERVESFTRAADGTLAPKGEPVLIGPGYVDAVSPRIGDIHRVSNGLSDQVSISIHVYGANIGAVRRATYTPEGAEKPFISGYANSLLPNLWDRSAS